MNKRLHGRTILIAGGASGIGLAVARAAKKKGSKIIIASRSAGTKRAEITQSLGNDTGIHNLDITDDSDIGEFFSKVSHIDHMIFTVRPEYTPESFAETDIRQAQAAFNTKFWGQYLVIQKSLKSMRAGGSIILTSGIAGTKVYQKSSTMALINSATETLVKSLAIEISPIRINAVRPGFIEPKPETVNKYSHSFPLKRLGRIDEICAAYIYLLENTYITGSVLTVDGGATLI